MRSEPILWDAGPLIALADARDANHESCTSVLGALRGQPLTTEAVVTEAHYVLDHLPFAPLVLLNILQHAQVGVPTLDMAMRVRMVELMDKYSDAPMDYGDASLVALAEAVGTRRIFTLDRRHFLTYRLYDRESFQIVP